MQCNINGSQFSFPVPKKDAFCTPLVVTESYSLDFLIKAKHSGNAGLTKENFLACLQSLEAMIELSIYLQLHNQLGFRYVHP